MNLTNGHCHDVWDGSGVLDFGGTMRQLFPRNSPFWKAGWNVALKTGKDEQMNTSFFLLNLLFSLLNLLAQSAFLMITMITSIESSLMRFYCIFLLVNSLMFCHEKPSFKLGVADSRPNKKAGMIMLICSNNIIPKQKVRNPLTRRIPSVA